MPPSATRPAPNSRQLFSSAALGPLGAPHKRNREPLAVLFLILGLSHIASSSTTGPQMNLPVTFWLLGMFGCCLAANYHVLATYSDANCAQTRTYTRFLPVGCIDYQSSRVRRDSNETHLWTVTCSESSCTNCSAPAAFVLQGSCGIGMVRSAGQPSLDSMPQPATNNILTYWRNTAICSPSAEQVDEVRAQPAPQVCHREPGSSRRYYFQCSQDRKLQIVNCTEPSMYSCGAAGSCSATTLPDSITSICFTDFDLDLYVTYSCNLTHFINGDRVPPPADFSITIPLSQPAAAPATAPSVAPTSSSTPTSTPTTQQPPASSPTAAIPATPTINRPPQTSEGFALTATLSLFLSILIVCLVICP